MNIISYLIYLYLNYTFTVKIAYTNPYEQITGIFISLMFGVILDGIAYKIAYSATGMITTNYDSPIYRSFVHYTIRAILWGIIIILGLTGLYTTILTPINHFVTVKWKNYIDYICSSLQNAILSQTIGQ